VRRIREERGYSMIELLVVMAIMGVVVGGLTTVFVSGSKAELDMNMRFSAQQNARMALSQLRNDLHISCDVDASTAGQLLLYPSAGSSTTPTCAGTANIVWCTAASPSNSARYALYQASAATCASPPAGKLFTDYLTTNALFTRNAPASGSKQRMSVTVDLPVNTNKARSASTTVDRYELKDTIVLRNSLPG
jgi:prepilin-type N-terminal cleavage/methylation domain-containing protein